MVKTPPREPELTPQNSGNANNITEYTGGDDEGDKVMKPAQPKLSGMET